MAVCLKYLSIDVTICSCFSIFLLNLWGKKCFLHSHSRYHTNCCREKQRKARWKAYFSLEKNANQKAIE